MNTTESLRGTKTSLLTSCVTVVKTNRDLTPVPCFTHVTLLTSCAIVASARSWVNRDLSPVPRFTHVDSPLVRLWPVRGRG